MKMLKTYTQKKNKYKIQRDNKVYVKKIASKNVYLKPIFSDKKKINQRFTHLNAFM